MSEVVPFFLSGEECQVVFRALLEHRKALAFSRWADNPSVEREIQCIDVLSERMSLTYFYPETKTEAAK